MRSLPPIRNLLQLFFDEKFCINFCIYNGLLYKERECPNCKKQMNFYPSEMAFRCGIKSCRKKVGYKANSFFARSHLGCGQILHLAYLWLSKTTHGSAEIQTGLSRQVICDFFGHFRELVQTDPIIEENIIGGGGIVVELDESKIGKRKYNRGHHVEGVWIFGGVERTAEKKTFFVPVADRSAETLGALIRRHVKPGSIIHTDLWRGYSNLEAMGFTHLTVNHSVSFINKESGVHTNMIEGIWNGFKVCIAPRNRVKDGIETRIAEYQWRRMNNNDLWNGFLRLLKDTHFN